LRDGVYIEGVDVDDRKNDVLGSGGDGQVVWVKKGQIVLGICGARVLKLDLL
jgi:hypothetical protein